MANQDKGLTEEEKKELILDAVRTLNFSDYQSYAELESDLCTRVRTLQNLLSERSLPMRMLEGIPIYAEVISCEKEESTSRYLLTFKASNANEGDEPEHIRSDRTDGRGGRGVETMWAAIEPGQRVLLYKLIEETNNAKKPKVRVAPYITVIGRVKK